MAPGPSVVTSAACLRIVAHTSGSKDPLLTTMWAKDGDYSRSQVILVFAVVRLAGGAPMGIRRRGVSLLRGVLTAGVWLGGAALAPVAVADPDWTPAENQFISDLLVPKDWGAGHPEVMAHPPLTAPALVQMGHRACSDIAGGVSPDVERDNLVTGLVLNQGVAASRADVGTLVHFALKDLCPNVPNTTGI
jgi:hypothetical protein